MEPWIGQETIDHIPPDILSASDTLLSSKGVNEIARPLLDDIFTGRRPDVISLGFAIALWSGSRAVNVFVDTITIMYGLDGRWGSSGSRPPAFVLLPGRAGRRRGGAAADGLVPDTVVSWMPASETAIASCTGRRPDPLRRLPTTLYDASVP
ncbi:YihY/virulence factor BrkB family protein OS=Streptomyces rimosus subsp. rimosus (strain ATCC / DSM 40260 / JCM 4667 / NRRL 2234) OX=1265868 GN=SRIM_032390 PE=4 SV=1 [Streptomyces rimosus subsp. rimosus]